MANPLEAAADLMWTGSVAPFRGAEPSRLYMDRLGTANSADNEITGSLRPLRARARDLVRNNPYAAGIVESFADNVIGWEGIRLKPKIASADGTLIKPVNWAIEQAWTDWGCEYATVDQIESWLEIERLIVKSWVTDGEVFIRRRRGWENPYAFAVELIDPDLLDENYNVPAERNHGNAIVMGVEMDANGRHLFYHFWDRHPDDLGRKRRVPIPAEDIAHLFVRYRAGQSRGYSRFAPVLTTVENIDGLTEAELIASRYHASKMGFITNDTPEAVAAYATRLSMQAANGAPDEPRRVKIAPGIVEELEPGKGFTSFDPNHPNDAFEAFLKVMMLGVSRGFSMSYLTVTGDVSAANYSSMRAGLLPERDHWKAVQNIVSRQVHRPIYRDWIGSALLTGAVSVPSPIASDYYAVEWRGRRWDWVDPLKDIEASEAEVKLGVNSRQRIASEAGYDYETIIDESAEDMAYAKDAGVYVGGQNSPLPPKPSNGNGSNGNGNGQSANRLTLAPYQETHTHGD